MYAVIPRASPSSAFQINIFVQFKQIFWFEVWAQRHRGPEAQRGTESVFMRRGSARVGQSCTYSAHSITLCTLSLPPTPQASRWESLPLVPVAIETLFAFPSKRVGPRPASRLLKRSCRSACKRKQPSIRGASPPETLRMCFRLSRKEVKEKERGKLDPGFSLDLQTPRFLPAV